MTTQIKRRRGDTDDHSSWIGAEAEITIDTDKNTVVVHDGSTAGGFPLAKEASPAFTGDVSIPDKIVHTGDTDTAIRFPAADTIAAETAGSEVLRVDSNGNVLIGDSAGQIGKLSTLGTGNHISAIRHSTDINSSNFIFAKYRGTRASPTTVVDGDMIGDLAWYGYNGSSIIKAASVSASASSTVDGSNMPTDLIFKTTEGNTNAERMRIDRSGSLLIGGTLPASPSTTITAAGAITAAGQILSSNTGGNVYINTGNAGNALMAYDSTANGAVPKATITKSGVATFTGATAGLTVEGATATNVAYVGNGEGTTGASLPWNSLNSAYLYMGKKAGTIVSYVDKDGKSYTADDAYFAGKITTTNTVKCRDVNSEHGGFYFTSTSILPTQADGNYATTGLSLGQSGNKFNDLFLAGDVTAVDATFSGDLDVAGYIKKNTSTGSLCTYIGDTYLRVYSSPTSLDNYKISLENTGDADFVGDITGATKNFRISHPLPAKKDAYYLVHSSIEGPQADLIYSGMVTLVAGKAEINLDTAARMTEGTFLLLNTNLRRFVSNEGGWTAVKSSITGNVLTVEAQDDTCTDEVFWTVIGERKDQHMLDTNSTDENGRLITEPLKPVVEEEES